MSNPTLNTTQFVLYTTVFGPNTVTFNILPDISLTNKNPTISTNGSSVSQFTISTIYTGSAEKTYDILPNTNLRPKNPTLTINGSTVSQFTISTIPDSTELSYDILPNEDLTPKNPTISITGINQPQFTISTIYSGSTEETYDILPNADLKPKNPTLTINGTNQTQFTLSSIPDSAELSYDILPNADLKPKNPTLTINGASISQFTLFNIPDSAEESYDILPNADLKPKNPTTLGNSIKPTGVTDTTINTQYDTTKSYIADAIISNPSPDNKPLTTKYTNMDAEHGKNMFFRFAGSAAAGISGIPQVSQIVDTYAGSPSVYATLQLDQLKPLPGVKYSDFRSRRQFGENNALRNTAHLIRLDGASAASRGNLNAGVYAAAAASPAGAYSIYNLDGFGKTGYGWGSHDATAALRNDFTIRSHVATKWDNDTDNWIPTINPIEIVTPFRGDRVNVIDFGKRTLDQAYRWNPRNILGANNPLDLTQDFIKFFLTGPALQNGVAGAEDDIIIFRATLNSLSDTFSPNWTPVQMIGRADSNYHYGGVTRDINLDFTVYATDRDEVKPIWRKLNALAGYTAPEYDTNSIAMRAPWMRITIGDLFHQQPVIITNLSYTLHDSDTTWEINIERDKTMMQVPHKITVSLGLSMISDFLPQKRGRFYSLVSDVKKDSVYNGNAQPKSGDHDWLSESVTNPVVQPLDNKYLPSLPISNTTPTATNTDEALGNKNQETLVAGISSNQSSTSGLGKS